MRKGNDFPLQGPADWLGFRVFGGNPQRGGIRICFRSFDLHVCPS